MKNNPVERNDSKKDFQNVGSRVAKKSSTTIKRRKSQTKASGRLATTSSKIKLDAHCCILKLKTSKLAVQESVKSGSGKAYSVQSIPERALPSSGSIVTAHRVSLTSTVRSKVMEELRRHSYRKYDLNSLLDEAPLLKPQTAITKGNLYGK